MKKMKVTQVKSSAHRLASHKACLKGLGLRRIGHTVEVEDTPSTSWYGKSYITWLKWRKRNGS